MLKTAETSPIPMVELREDAIFLGPDDVALTEYGMKLHKLLHDHHTLIQIYRNDTAEITDERRKTVLTEQEELCKETKIDPFLIGMASNQFFQMVNRRLNAMMEKNGSNGFFSNGYNGHK